MTIEEIKQKYGDKTGYVFCNNCPLKDCKGDCVLHMENSCDGRDMAYAAIKEHCSPDNVNHPSHYNQGGIECIDAMVSAFGKEAVGNFCICNAFKYVWRAKQKNGVEDLGKAIWYLNKVKELTADEAV